MHPRCRSCRIALAALYGLTVLAACALWCAIPTEAAFAYVDPSVMTYAIQAIAGLAVALSAVIGVVFRRTRKRIYRIFRIDENAHKLLEEDVTRIDAQDPAASQQRDEAEAYAQHLIHENELMATRNNKRALGWKGRFAFSLVMAIFAAFIIFMAPALEIIGSNSDSLVFGLGQIGWIPVVFCLVFGLIAAFLLSALRGGPFYTILLLVFSVTLCAYIQSLFLNQGMMPADGGFLNWTDSYFTDKMIVSGIVWIAIIACVLIASRGHRHLWLKGATAVACAIMIMQLVGVISVVATSEDTISEAQRPYVTQEGLLDLASQNNVVVFVLDTYDTALLEQIIAEDPEFLDSLTGFTYFDDSTGTMIPTSNAIPNLLSGRKPQPGESIEDYRRERYGQSTFIPTIHDLGYSLGIYTDSLMMDYDDPAELALTRDTINIHPVSKAPIDLWQTFLATMQCALYRESPWVAKPCFWYYTSDLNNRMIDQHGDKDLADTLYELDDAEILQLLRDQRLEVHDRQGSGAFRFIHLFGPHFPFSVDEMGNNIGTNRSDQLSQAKGSMRVVLEYLEQMKALGIYDEATVIITADHGVWNLAEDPLQQPISPIMIAKPSYGAHDPAAQEPLVVSHAPVSHEDLQATILAAMGVTPDSGALTLFSAIPADRIRTFDALTNAGDEGQRFIEYTISGNAMDIQNWQKSGVEWKDS